MVSLMTVTLERKMEIVRIDQKSLPHFELILTAEALAGIGEGQGDVYALGAIEGGMPVGAAAVRFDPPAGRLLSLYVVEGYRRRGIGATLCIELLNAVMARPKMEMFVAPYTVKEEDVFTPFFTSMMFDIDEVGSDQILTVKKALDAMGKPMEGRAVIQVEPYTKLTSREKNLLLQEDTDLSGYIEKGQLREDLTFVIMDKERTALLACIVFAEIENELILAWLSLKQVNVPLLKLLDAVRKQVEKSDKALKKVHVPTINERSEQLLTHLFGEKPERVSTSYEAVFSFAAE